MVFLRPVVVRDAARSDQLSLDRYDLMRGAQSTTGQPPHSLVVPVNSAPVMPDARRPQPAGAPGAGAATYPVPAPPPGSSSTLAPPATPAPQAAPLPLIR